MKVIHVPYCFCPDPVGGTEIYVEALAQNLKKMGVESVICAPAEKTDIYSHNGLRVRRFALPSAVHDLRELYGEGNFEAARAFGQILDEEKPDLVHLHAFTRGASLLLVREAKKRGIPAIFTYHTPTVSCQRGTLMRWGKEVCDGALRLHTCSRCTLHGLGLDRYSASFIGSLPPQAGQFIGNLGLSGGAWTALRMTELMELRHSTFRQLMEEIDHIIAPANWARDLLIRNRVPTGKISVSRQGLCATLLQSLTHDTKLTTHDLKVVFMGRLAPEKRAHILIQAFRSDPELKATLDIYGIIQGEGSREYEKKLHSLAGNDTRIQFFSAVPADKVGITLQSYDVLAVPSQWLETGPMVILEAFAAGIPVMGSNLGGIAESIENEVNGILLKPDSVKEWGNAIQQLSKDRQRLNRLKNHIASPRNIETVTEEMLTLYEVFAHSRKT